jgi:hypothetical protein
MRRDRRSIVTDTFMGCALRRSHAAPAAAPVTIAATTNRHPDRSAIRPAPAPITAISISIHNLHNGLRYAGHELPECVCPRRTCCPQSVLQSDLQQPTAGVQAILRFGAGPIIHPSQSLSAFRSLDRQGDPTSQSGSPFHSARISSSVSTRSRAPTAAGFSMPPTGL